MLFLSHPGQSMWDSWWRKWHWDRLVSMLIGFLLSISFHHSSPYSYIVWWMHNRPLCGCSSGIFFRPTDMNINNLILSFIIFSLYLFIPAFLSPFLQLFNSLLFCVFPSLFMPYLFLPLACLSFPSNVLLFSSCFSAYLSYLSKIICFLFSPF